ncbi:hypothetical protein [Shewanella violacea]|uniref:Uncharacterized protein n=1 Tax=Shewanella violacea (strain JCM 10179 / CIP 106290 / LMG 19151 / DSS12) TaxID=637905 RepID=D4ZJ51_SHEVD|nr:hypothetical protein [Shewanella violacea]BAJ01700.1 hypothetical protein SVI_1729 [Shewanella violacea DSS12]
MNTQYSAIIERGETWFRSGGASHRDVVNVRNAWMQLLTKLSGGATAMDGGSVDIEGAFIDRHRG